MWSVSCKNTRQTCSLLTVGYFSLLQKRTDSLCSPRNLQFNWHRLSFHGAKRPGRVAKCSTPSSVQVKNGWHWTSAPPIHLHVCYTVSLLHVVPFAAKDQSPSPNELSPVVPVQDVLHVSFPRRSSDLRLAAERSALLFVYRRFFLQISDSRGILWNFYVVFSVTSGKSAGSTWNWTTTAPFHISSKSLFINHLIIQHC